MATDPVLNLPLAEYPARILIDSLLRRIDELERLSSGLGKRVERQSDIIDQNILELNQANALLEKEKEETAALGEMLNAKHADEDKVATERYARQKESLIVDLKASGVIGDQQLVVLLTELDNHFKP